MLQQPSHDSKVGLGQNLLSGELTKLLSFAFQVCYLQKEFSYRKYPAIAGELYAREGTFRNYNNSLVS
jgi:hypothetical protein